MNTTSTYEFPSCHLPHKKLRVRQTDSGNIDLTLFEHQQTLLGITIDPRSALQLSELLRRLAGNAAAPDEEPQDSGAEGEADGTPVRVRLDPVMKERAGVLHMLQGVVFTHPDQRPLISQMVQAAHWVVTGEVPEFDYSLSIGDDL